jgi:hypothetical protein
LREAGDRQEKKEYADQQNRAKFYRRNFRFSGVHIFYETAACAHWKQRFCAVPAGLAEIVTLSQHSGAGLIICRSFGAQFV